MGGLSRISFKINQLREKKPGKTLILDAGGMLTKKSSLSGNKLEQAKIYAHAIAHCKLTMGVSAFGIASQDLSLGIEYLKSLKKEFNFPWLSMNLVSKGDAKPLFSASLITEVNGVKLAILGLTGEESGRKNPQDQGYRIIPWRDVLPETLREIKAQADMIILLSSYPPGVNKKIAEQYQDIHIIFQSGHGKKNVKPQNINNTLVLQTGSRGKYLGVMEIDWHKSSRWGAAGDTTNSAQIQQLNGELDRFNWQIKRLSKRLPAEEKTLKSKYNDLVKSRELLIQDIAKLQEAAQANLEEPSSYTNRFISLRMGLKEDKNIKSIVEAAKSKANTSNRKRLPTQK